MKKPIPKYRCTYDVEQAAGWQYYTVDADSPEEAHAELEAGGGAEEDFEVTKGNFDWDTLEEIGLTDEEQK